MTNKPTIIVEKIYEGSPGEGYECGVQFIDSNGNDHTQSGYFGKTPEQALVRLLINESKGAINLARAVADGVENLRAVTQYLADKWSIDLINLPPVEYSVEEKFNASKVHRLEKENVLLRRFAEHCETLRRNFQDAGESDKAGAAYHLIFMSGKAEEALKQSDPNDPLPSQGD